MIGVAFAFLAAIGWAVSAVLTPFGLKGVRVSAGIIISIVASLFFTAVVALMTETRHLATLNLRTLLAFFLVGFLSYVLGRQLNFLGISYVGASRATPVLAAAPLFAIFLAVVFTGERLNLPILAGAALILGGMWLVLRSGAE